MHATLEAPVEFRDALAGDDLRELCPRAQLILDVGAGAGGFATQARTVWPDATIVSFEPAMRFNGKLKPLDERHSIVRQCVGAFPGKTVLHLTHGAESNSLLSFLPDGPLCKVHQVVGTEEVEQVTLDSLTLGKVDILKMDVQGAELLVLDGSPKLLRRDKPIIYCEVAFQQQYAGQPLIGEVDEYLAARGYRRLHVYASPMPDIWGDAIYVPEESSADSAIRLNIGAGDTVIPGFTAIDRKFGTEAYPLDYPDNSVDEIRCVHMLEHLSYKEVPEALQEWHRVLKPGGRLRVSVPDVESVVKLRDSDPHWAFYLMGGQTDANDFHKSAWDETRLQGYLELHGFGNVQRWTSQNTDLAASDISLNLEGFKDAPVDVPASVDVKLRAVCGCPRIGWNDGWQSLVDAMYPFNIPIETHQGCFWAQNIQKCLERALRDGIDWVITLDYDSMVLPCHVRRLLEIMGTHPEIDACAALQMRRGAETPLFSTGKTQQEFDQWEPVQVNTAHFGLTIIRAECLNAIAKPWLIDVPDAHGGYSGDHTDADITFWKKWKAAGKSVYVAPDVRIGHLELLVSEFDEELKPRHFHIHEWWSRHAKAGETLRSKKED